MSMQYWPCFSFIYACTYTHTQLTSEWTLCNQNTRQAKSDSKLYDSGLVNE